MLLTPVNIMYNTEQWCTYAVLFSSQGTCKNTLLLHCNAFYSPVYRVEPPMGTHFLS